MNLQDILWPKDGICTDMEMYFHSNYKINLIKKEDKGKVPAFCFEGAVSSRRIHILTACP